MNFPKRLIEVDLPIARISAHSRREKSIRHGHISTLHIWWARRPLAACRAVVLASLWPDPVDLAKWREVDEFAPAVLPHARGTRPIPTVLIHADRFLSEARTQLRHFADQARVLEQDKKICEETAKAFAPIAKDPAALFGPESPTLIRELLLHFIADFANWDNSTDPLFLETARALTQAAHESLGGEPGTRPMVIDPFAGGGSIPLEALRVGADAFASDLNPVPVLLNKVVLEYIPKHGQRLADEVRRWGAWIKERAEVELAAFYPPQKVKLDAYFPQPKAQIKLQAGGTWYLDDVKLETPIAYLWARTVLSEAPGQGDIPVEIPLMRSMWLAKKSGRKQALRWVRDPDTGKVKTKTIEVTYSERDKPDGVVKRIKRPLLEIFHPKKDSEVEGGTVARGHATCPVTGHTTPVDSVREQLKRRRGGAADARLFAVVTTLTTRRYTGRREEKNFTDWSEQGRFYRLPTKGDEEAFAAAGVELHARQENVKKGVQQGAFGDLSLVPDEALDIRGIRHTWAMTYGLERWGDLFSPRQSLALATLARLVREAGEHMKAGRPPHATPDDARQRAESAGSDAADGGGGGEDGDPATRQADGRTRQAVRRVRQGDGRERQADGRDRQEDGRTRQAAGTPRPPGDRERQADRRDLQPDRRVAGTADGAPDQRAGSTSNIFGADETDAAPAVNLGPTPPEMAEAVQTCLAMTVGRQSNQLVSMGRWNVAGEKVEGIFARQAIGMVWDFAEVNLFSGSTGDFDGAIEWVAAVCEANAAMEGRVGQVEQASATHHPLPDDSVAALVTDPPYYDAVPYAYLSDFFYVWFRRTLSNIHPSLTRDPGVPKDEEIVVDRPHTLSQSVKDISFYERELARAFAEARRVVRPDGVGCIVFASKSTASWEAILKAVIDAGWIVTGSWPIDTEMETRVAAQGQARLGSSVHIVVRPRETASGAVDEGEVGDWRTVLEELPKRIREWMPRLDAEGVVGADAIFACLGPALEVYSRYARVERASGEAVLLPEYLEHVWATVSTEALTLIFKDGGADAGGLEPDARLTAMWLWTLGATKADNAAAKADDDEGGDDDEDAKSTAAKPIRGFALEFDAARKIAQGLGVHLEKCQSFVEIKGETARLLSMNERVGYLFGKDSVAAGGTVGDERPKSKKKKAEASLFETAEQVKVQIEQAEAEAAGKLAASKPGATILDRVHQGMLLFASQRGEALRRFLVDDGVGKDARFWKLANSLNKLYPAGSAERIAVEGVLARKKSFGF